MEFQDVSPYIYIFFLKISKFKIKSLPDGFVEEMDGRGITVGWHQQEAVLAYAAMVGF